MKNKTAKQFKNGLIDQNPVLVLMLGICPALATSSTVADAAGMSIAVIAVLLFSNIIISAIRKLISPNIRVPVFIVVISGLVGSVDYLMRAYTPSLSDSLGIFIPLIVTNCIVLARVEAFASKNTVGSSVIDGLAMGIGFASALLLLAAIRELLSSGRLMNIQVLPQAFPGIHIIARPAGGFLILGFIVAAMQAFRRKGGSA
ncbi:MAG: electron transport complex subunit RsxE [Oscillospiraceae bacterium]|nr:electron transport complex subunit RsxE [Oscillospiraceae bacterium]